MATSFPGFETPAVGFEQPFEMLLACHDRVRRSLRLLERLMAHVGTRGHDEHSRSAAADVLRYFELAAPLHHQDEELHVFPALSSGGADVLPETVEALLSDHRSMEKLWTPMAVLLRDWLRPDAALPADDIARDCQQEFTRLYTAHLQTEEGIVFPAARARMDAHALLSMSADMQRRRTQPR
jgi:hemerythrin-like domain-containing protein